MSITQNGIKLHNKRKGYCCAFLFNALELALSALLVVTLSAHIIFPEQARGARGVSSALSYQGRLTSSTTGNPVTDGTYCVKFSIYDAASGGTKLWPSTPSSMNATTTNGIFNIGIGDTGAGGDDLSTFDFSTSSTMYLNVDVYTVPTTCTGGGWETLSPRQRLDAVAYARVAADVYGTTLQTDNANNAVQIGPAAGVAGDPTLFKLGTKTSSASTFTSVGQSCTGLNGAIWYNSATTRALICENNTVRALSNATTTIDAISTPINTYTSGTVMISGGNNITVTTNGQTISISGANQSVQTQNLQSIVLSSNTAGVMATISSGQMTLAGGNNITLSQNGNAVTISAGAGGGGAALAVSNIGTTFTSGTVQFSAGNLISLGTGAQAIIVSNVLSSSAIAQDVASVSNAGTLSSRFALADHAHRGIGMFQISGGNTSNTSNIVYGSLAFAGGNNITLSQVSGVGGATVTIVGAAGGGGFANSIAAGGVTTGGLNTINFSNANGVSFGLGAGANSSVMTASVAAGGGGVQPMRWTQIPAFRFSLSNLTNITAITYTPFFQPFRIDGNLTLSRLNWEMSRATSGSNSFGVTAGIYSYVNDTQISLLGSAVGAFSNSATASVSGIRRFGISGFDVSTFAPGGYILGMMFNSGPGTASLNYSIRGHSGAVQLGAINEGTNNYNTATSYNIFPFLGRFSTTTAAFPGSVADSQIRGQFAGASAPINAWIGFNND